MNVAQLLPIPMPKADGTGINIFWSPRLRTSGNLATYLDWRDWPAAQAGLTVSFQFENAAGFTQTIVAGAPEITPDSNVWRALFGDPAAIPTPQLPVFYYQYTDRTQQTVRSWGASSGAQALEDFYNNLVDAFPINIPGAADIPNAALANVVSAGNEFRAYAASMRANPSNVPGAPNPLERWGFHDMVGMAQSHPYLMNLLGLVTEHSVTVPTTIGTVPNAGPPTKVRVITDYAASFANREQIPVAMSLVAGQMRASATGPFPLDDDGWLQASGWRLSTLDHRSGLQQIVGWQKSIDENENPLPLPPANAITVLLNDTGPQMEARTQSMMARHKAMEQQILALGAGDEVLLERDDVTVGFRFDVRDETKANPKFLSLFERRPIVAPVDGSEYRFDGTTFIVTKVPDDEGWVVPTLTSEDTETAMRPPNNLNDFETQFYAPQAEIRSSPQLFSWDGWSGATPRPGNVVDNDGNVSAPDGNEPGTVTGVRQVGVNYRPVPGTLPQLRYGHVYRFRGRAVDLAGDSQSVGVTEPATARSSTIRFGRTQQIPAPIPARAAAKPVPGVREALDAVVILSELGDTNGDIARSERVFYPPSTQQLTLERHGIPGDGDDAASYGLLAARDALSIDDQTDPDSISAERISENKELRPVVAYLPDPAGDGVTFAGLPGAAGPTTAPVVGNWPDLVGCSLQLVAGTGAPQVDPEPQVSVRVFIPKSDIHRVDVSMALDDLVDWYLAQNGSPLVQTAMTSGRQWMASGRLPITLIHATRLPLSLPVPSDLSATRPLLTDDAGTPLSPGLGSLEALISLTVDAHAQSTARVRCLAKWTDPIDEGPGTGTPGTTTTEGDVGTRTRTGEFGALPIAYDDPDDQVAGTDMVLQMRDAKAHDVCVTIEALSRFSEYFTERVTVDFQTSNDAIAVLSSRLPASGTVQEGVVARSVIVRDTAGDIVDASEYTIDRDAGTITPTAGGELENEAGVTVDFVPLPVSRLSTGLTPGDPGVPPIVPAKVVVPASRRPKIPEIFEIIPSVARDVREEDGTIRIRHNGQVLRFFLERPWWTSGRDEQLAVVLFGDPTNSVLGRDPVFAGSGLPAPMEDTDWRRATVRGTFDGLDVAGHSVQWDADSERWVADLEVSADVGYRPFLRPVVCRLQPDAIAAAHLSERVIADPHRFGVQRQVQIRPGQSSVAVTVTGPDNDGVTHEGTLHRNEVDAYFQVREAGVVDPDLAWMDVPLSMTRLERRERGDGWTNWTAKLPIPTPGVEHRLVLEETEPGIAEPQQLQDELVRTTVYVETVELP